MGGRALMVCLYPLVPAQAVRAPSLPMPHLFHLQAHGGHGFREVRRDYTPSFVNLNLL